jgi:hypothetical protein
LATSLSIVRRILPQISTSQEAVPSSSNWLSGWELAVAPVVTVVPPLVVVVPTPPPAGSCERCAVAATPTVGSGLARAWLTTATAWRQAASDALSVWLETSICFSRSSSVGSS